MPTKQYSTKQYATLDEIAGEFQCSVRHLRRLISRNELKAYRIGRDSHVIRVDREDLPTIMEPVILQDS